MVYETRTCPRADGPLTPCRKGEITTSYYDAVLRENVTMRNTCNICWGKGTIEVWVDDPPIESPPKDNFSKTSEPQKEQSKYFGMTLGQIVFWIIVIIFIMAGNK